MNSETYSQPNIFPNIVRINLETNTIKREIVDSSHPLKIFGGRSFSSKIIADEIPPMSDPLGIDNKLIFSTGFLTGTPAPNTGRISIGAKSPLTHGIKESNVGGRAPAFLIRNNIKALILENQATTWKIIQVEEGQVKVLDGESYVGLNNYELAKKLKNDFGEKIGAFMIGSGGESLFQNSSIASIDMEGYPSRHAGRGGLGAVMGSKKVKAIIISSPKKILMKYFDQPAFKETARPWFKTIHEATKDTKHIYGTPGCLREMNSLHGLPTQNYRRGQFKDVDKIDGDAVHQLILKNKGKYGLSCSPGCAIQCSNQITDSDGNYITSSFEYETIGLLGSNLMISDLEKIAKLDQLCDDIGIDTIETGACLGLFMEAGKINWGDGDACIKLVKGIYDNNPESLMLGLGVYELGKKLGVERIPHVKRQSFPSYMPRALKAPAITFLTSPMGADHTSGDISGNNAADPEGKLALSKMKQISTYIVDSLGICYFVGLTIEQMADVGKLVAARYGNEWLLSVDEWEKWAWNCLKLERDFNTKAGLDSIDQLPNFMQTEPLEEIEIKWDFDQTEIDTYWENIK